MVSLKSILWLESFVLDKGIEYGKKSYRLLMEVLFTMLTSWCYCQFLQYSVSLNNLIQYPRTLNVSPLIQGDLKL